MDSLDIPIKSNTKNIFDLSLLDEESVSLLLGNIEDTLPFILCLSKNHQSQLLGLLNKKEFDVQPVNISCLLEIKDINEESEDRAPLSKSELASKARLIIETQTSATSRAESSYLSAARDYKN